MEMVTCKAEILQLSSSKQPGSASSQVALSHVDYVNHIHNLVLVVEVDR